MKKIIMIEYIEDCILAIGNKGKIDRNKNLLGSLLFLCKIYELVKDLKILVNNNSLNSTPILIRTLFQITYDLKNMSIYSCYIDKLMYTAAIKEVKRIKNLKKYDEYKNSKKLKSKYELLMNIIENIPENLRKEIEGNDIIYRIVYSNLSNESHANITSLEKHFLSEEGGKLKIHYDVGKSDFSKREVIIVINILILDSIISVGKIHNLKINDYEIAMQQLIEEISV